MRRRRSLLAAATLALLLPPLLAAQSPGGRDSLRSALRDSGAVRDTSAARKDTARSSSGIDSVVVYTAADSVRYDLGSIWTVPSEVRLVDLRHGIGGALALDTPVGPVEFALGQSFFFRKDLLNNPISFGPLLGYFRIGYAF